MRQLIKSLSVIIVALAFLSFGKDESKDIFDNALPFQTPAIDSKQINGNYISTWFRNNGSFDRHPASGNGGFEWPNGSGRTLTYASGIWLIAKIGNDTLMATAEYSYEFLPGYIDANGNPQGKDDPFFHVYKIVKGDTLSADYINWPVSQGAYLDSVNKPFLPGKQTLFFSMSDGYPESHTAMPGGTAPMKAQVQVTTWCYNDFPETALRNCVFTEFKIINKSQQVWNDAIISVWSDACSDEQIALGCDSVLNIAYAYCKSNSHYYGNKPPAFGFVLLKGPDIYSGNPNDTVYSFIPGKSQRRVKVGYKEVKFASFYPRTNADPTNGDPQNYREAYLVMQGFHRNGNPWISPVTNSVTKFPYSGDPETNTGWNQWVLWGFGNRRYNANYGMTNLNPGDTQTIVIAEFVSRGMNNLNSATRFKSDARYIMDVFNQNFTTVDIKHNDKNIPDEFRLFQNYPNPFNPNTSIKFYSPVTARIILKVYDITGKEISELMNGSVTGGTHEVMFNSSELASGVYFCRLFSAESNLEKTFKGQTIKMIVTK